MSMSGDTLGSEIAQSFFTGDMSQEEKDDLETQWKNVANKIINHIKNNAELNTASCSGVTGAGTPGGPLPITNQPVTGGVK